MSRGMLKSRSVEPVGSGVRMHGITYVGGLPLDGPINEAEFATLAQDDGAGVLVADELEHITNRKLIAELAEKSWLPAIYPLKLFVESGGLIRQSLRHPISTRVVSEPKFSIFDKINHPRG